MFKVVCLKLLNWWYIWRILVWGDGYYNGAIKTRKTVQPMEVSAEEASLQRSQQLRELYESLSAGDTNPPARRPCAALSPEDLTESEWFYLMCVSFSFPPGVGYVTFIFHISIYHQQYLISLLNFILNSHPLAFLSSSN